jgi:GNAT superfamily N-acetyltransferase
MNTSNYTVSLDDTVQQGEVVALYTANGWSSAEKPELLIPALNNSHTLVTTRDVNGVLIGIGNAISDGYLVVYYPHMLVDPKWQGKSVGKAMMDAMQTRYAGFHQQMLTADGDAIGFYKALGFERAGQTEPMWIYAGNEH